MAATTKARWRWAIFLRIGTTSIVLGAPASSRPGGRSPPDALAEDSSQNHDRILPELDLGLKLLRDILNHPSITKNLTDETTRETVSYNSIHLYGLAVSDVTDVGTVLDTWLDEVCECYDYERFCDTKKLIEDLADELDAKPAKIDTF